MSSSAFSITVDGRSVAARAGQSLAAALVGAGIRAFHRTTGGELRGPYCGIGLCFECVVTVDGEPNVRACMVPAREGMEVLTGAAGGTP